MKRPLAAIVILLGAPLLAGCLDGGLVGEPVPAFEVVTLDGERVNQTSYLGRWLVLDLMATWCGPCKLEVPHLREVQRVHGDEVAILSISVEPQDTPAAMEAFGAEFGVTWPSALDPGRKVAQAMGLTIIPKLLVVDPEGIVRFEAQGEVLPAAITRVIDPSAAPPEDGLPVVPLLGGLAAGALVALNPYRRFHRDGGPAAAWLAVGAFALLALLVWRFAAFASSRATLTSLAGGALTLGAVAWWARARRRPGTPELARPHPALAAGDRLYEGAPHFALAAVLALQQGTTWGFVAPLAGFLVGAALSHAARGRVPEPARTWAGLAGLAAVGFALLAFGLRFLAAGAS